MSKEIKGGRMSGKTLFDEEEELTSLEALKRIRQETIPATYNQDFDKEECCKIIEKELKALNIIKENLNIDEILLAVKGVCKASDYDLIKEVLK